MPIAIEEETTRVTCDVCGFEEVTNKPNGVVPSNWGTGQIWLDVSLSEQKQYPICFCEVCKPSVLTSLKIAI